MSPQCLPSIFSSIRLKVWEAVSFEQFQDGHHSNYLGYCNPKLLAILNIHVAPMFPTKFQLNPTYNSGGVVENVKRQMDG